MGASVKHRPHTFEPGEPKAWENQAERGLFSAPADGDMVGEANQESKFSSVPQGTTEAHRAVSQSGDMGHSMFK